MTRRPPLYVLPGANPGLVYKGNIDINNRPSVPNKGAISTVASASSEVFINGIAYEGLFPTVIPDGRGGWKIASEREAYNYAVKHRRWLGIFDTVAHANAYSNRLHVQQARLLQQDRLRSGTR